MLGFMLAAAIRTDEEGKVRFEYGDGKLQWKHEQQLQFSVVCLRIFT